jgi:hypothetical protein
MTNTTDDFAELGDRLTAAAAAVAEAAAALNHLRTTTLRSVGRSEDRPDMGIKDLIPAADGADIAHRAKKTMTAWCKKNPIAGDAGFALKIGSRWLVSRSRLIRHLAEEAKSSGSSD